MDVTLAKTAGFCMGVKRAIEMALEASKKYRVKIYTYGPLIHNKHVLEMLQKKGIEQIEDPKLLKKGIILIRAHGIPPDERTMLEQTGLILIDATCPRVERVHRQIATFIKKNYEIIIFGDSKHAEVKAIAGTAGKHGILVTNVTDVEAIAPLSNPVVLVSQTTQSRSAYNNIIDVVKKRFSDAIIIDTLCSTTEGRQKEVLTLAAAHDAVVVVGGKNSANTTRLATLSKEFGTQTYHVETEEDLPNPFPKQLKNIAVTAGASTPNWMIERVVEKLEHYQQPFSLKALVIILLKFLAESNILVALGSASLAITSSYYLNKSIQIIPVAIAALYVYSMHILNHFADREAVAINEPLREEVFRRHQNIFIFLGILSGLSAIFLSAIIGYLAFFLLISATAIGAAYSFHIFPAFIVHYTGYRRLKDIPASKDFVVAIAWSSVTVFIPFIANSSQLSLQSITTLVLTWICAMLFVYIRNILLDLKDVQGDRIIGKETIPIHIGEKKALDLVLKLRNANMLLLFVGTVVKILPPLAFFQLLSFYPFLIVVSWNKKGKLRRRYLFQSLLDFGYLSSGCITLIYLFLISLV